MTGAAIVDRRRLIREVMTRYRAGAYRDALALAEEHVHLLSDDIERAWFRMCLRARGGDLSGSLSAFRDALDRGGWFDEAMLRDSDLDLLRGNADFERLSAQSFERRQQVQAEARPELRVLVPKTNPPPEGYPLLVALHGNSANAAVTAAEWEEATTDGWLVAVPQASEVGRHHGSFAWDDTDRATVEVLKHFADVRAAQPVDQKRVVFGGFSRGAFIGALLVVQGHVPGRGFVLVCPGVPSPDPLIEAGLSLPRRDLRGYVLLGRDDAPRTVKSTRKLVGRLNEIGIRCALHEQDGLAHDYPSDFPEILKQALAFVLDR